MKSPAQAAVTTATDTAAKIVADAADTAKVVVEKATKVAADLAVQTKAENDQTAASLAEALRQVFGENEASQRFIDVSRIPLICQSIVDIHKNIDKINNNITWAVRTVVGGVILALLTLLIKH